MLTFVAAVAGVAGVAGVTMKMNSKSAASQAAQVSLKAAAPKDWTQRDDVQAMNAKKVKYSDLSEDDVQGLFKQFQSTSTEHTILRRESLRLSHFKLFEEIDSEQNEPVGFFGITDMADKSDDERAMRRMSSKWTNLTT